ncbi:Shedu anti-phage system protein SduA domain-containing protein [Wenyingzhuangia sp. IMCC45574]
MIDIDSLIEEKITELSFSSSTCKTYKIWVFRFLEFIEIKDVNSIEFIHIEKYLNHIIEISNYSLSSQRQAYSSLEFLFNKTLDKNFPFNKIKIAIAPSKIPVAIPKEEVLQILNHITNIKHKTILALIYSCCLSTEDVINIQIDDYNSDEKVLTIRKDQKIYRKAPVGNILVPMLTNYIDEYNPINYLFENNTNHKKYSNSSIRKTFNDARDNLGLDKNYTCQNLKYSYVKHLVDEGFQLTDVLNHIKLKTYEKYSKIEGLHNSIIVSPIDSLIKKNPKIKLKITDEQSENFILTDKQTKRMLEKKPNLIKSFIENEINDSDITAIGYRKKQLEVFKNLLTDENYFKDELTRLNISGKENLWQYFFEKNTWIFGYGLNFIFSTNLEHKKIEQVVSGFSFNEYGKRVDGLLKTRGLISSLCFVEIKVHDTRLLSNRPYRSDCWSVSNELSGAVSQIQKTVQRSITNLPTQNRMIDREGNPTNETIFLYKPKSYLIIGNLNEFVTEHGVNESKFSSFELFRQNTNSPEIITYDELYERAKFLLDNKINK